MNISLFGAAPDTGNLGVSALCFSAVQALANRGAHRLWVFDHGRGCRSASPDFVDNTINRKPIVNLVGGVLTKKIFKSESYSRIWLGIRLGGLGSPGAKALLHSEAILDVSGGDSFSDIYGPRRFLAISQPKKLALKLGIPLILLPQTYGPFEDPQHLAKAKEIVARARVAIARDADSFSVLRQLLGTHYSPDRHWQGVDMAFRLPIREPVEVPELFERWQRDRDQVPIVGLNISGLMWFNADASKSLPLTANYQRAMIMLVQKLLASSPARILLTPHLCNQARASESDLLAAEDLMKKFDAARMGDRIALLDAPSDPRVAKWFIRQTDWFCGARMHSTIASLSTGVPTAAVAYSMKFRGVFECCGSATSVVDARQQTETEIVAALWRQWLNRSAAKRNLEAKLPAVLDQADRDFDRIIAAIPVKQSAGTAP